MVGEGITNLCEPKREVQIWRRQCPDCYKPLLPEEKKKKKSCKIKFLFCDRDLLNQKSIVSYPVNDRVKFVWQPSCRFEGYVYFEVSGPGSTISKINMKSFIYFKNKLVQLMKMAWWHCQQSRDHQITVIHKAKGSPFRLMFSMQLSSENELKVTFYEEGERADTVYAENTVIDHSKRVTLDEEELYRLITNIQLDYPDVIKTEVYIP